MRPPRLPRKCDRTGCDTQIVLAIRADTRRWVAYEAEPREPGTLAAAGCHVLVNDQAWRPGDLADHFRVQFEIASLERARELVRDYPHHRPHFHIDDNRGDTQ